MYKQDVLKLFCYNNDYYWAEKFAIAELLNSETYPGHPFIFTLFNYCRLSLQMLKLFVENGLNVKCVDESTNTLLHECGHFKNYLLIPFLVKSGVNINAKGYNEHTPLSASMCGNYNFEMAESLLEMGADVTRYLQRGRSIMEIAELAGAPFVKLVRCRMAMDALGCCLKTYSVSRDMINMICQLVWKTRSSQCWNAMELTNKKHKK
jgi:ankyrin repeat protein